MQKRTIITLLIWKLIRPLPSKFSLMRYIWLFRYKYLQLLHNGSAQNVIRMYAFLKCNELRNHHTQLTMQAQSVSMYTISNATMYCDRLFLAWPFIFSDLSEIFLATDVKTWGEAV